MPDETPSALPPRLRRWTPVLAFVKECLSILAIVIGSVWVLIMFGLKECPGREPNFELSTGLQWFGRPTPDTCSAAWAVTAKNLSTRSVDVDHVTVAVWPFSATPGGGAAKYIELEKLRPAAASWIAHSETTSQLEGHYTPDAIRTHTFQWIFRELPKGTSIAFEVKFFANKGDTQPFAYYQQWSSFCPP